MSVRGSSRAFRLDPVQDLLLGVALAQDGTAAARWAALREGVPMAELERGKIRRLLPLVAYALGADDPSCSVVDADRLAVATERARAEHATRVEWLPDLLRVLGEAGVRTLVMKGSALALTVYPDPARRPMVDVDLLVRPTDLERTIDLLAAEGWAAVGRLPQHHVLRGQEIDLRGPGGEKLDLHWHLHPAFVVRDQEATSDEPFLERAQPLKIENVATTMLDPTDQLLHVLVHGATNGWPSHPLWVVDAAMLADRTIAFDGARFIALARASGVAYPVARALDVLLTRFERAPRFVGSDGARVDVPAALGSRLTLRRRRLYFEIASGTTPPRWLQRGLGPVADTYHYWATQTVSWSRTRAIAEFPGWLADHWELAGPAQLPGKVAKAVARSVRGEADPG